MHSHPSVQQLLDALQAQTECTATHCYQPGDSPFLLHAPTSQLTPQLTSQLAAMLLFVAALLTTKVVASHGK